MFHSSLMPNRFLLGLAVPLLLILLQTPECFDVDARPESDTNDVGDRHRITANIDAGSGDEWLVLFEIIAGPNSGKLNIIEEIPDELFNQCISPVTIDEVIECALGLVGPACNPSCIGSGDRSVSWSYRGTGGEGTDFIVACAVDLNSLQEIGPVPMKQALASALSGEKVHIAQGVRVAQNEGPPQEEIDELESFGCDVVTKKWVDKEEEERTKNVGGIFAGDLDAAQRNRERARASAIVAATPRPADTAPIRPPSTGDAGLID